MNNTTTLAIFAVVAAMGLVGVMAVQIISFPAAEARGCPPTSGNWDTLVDSTPFKASEGRCLHP